VKCRELTRFAVLADEPLIIPDTQKDDRFACNPFVQSEPGVRFYAGAPLISQDGFSLGTLCVLDEPLDCNRRIFGTYAIPA
jgi:GAF domain-containing protein